MLTLLLLLLFITAVFLIFLILIQRGKGGGLAGAFGGMGGQSAFGTKAGDTFTKITIGVAAFWIILCLIGVKYLGGSNSKLRQSNNLPAADAPDTTSPAESPPVGETPAPE